MNHIGHIRSLNLLAELSGFSLEQLKAAARGFDMKVRLGTSQGSWFLAKHADVAPFNDYVARRVAKRDSAN